MHGQVDDPGLGRGHDAWEGEQPSQESSARRELTPMVQRVITGLEAERSNLQATVQELEHRYSPNRPLPPFPRVMRRGDSTWHMAGGIDVFCVIIVQ